MYNPEENERSLRDNLNTYVFVVVLVVVVVVTGEGGAVTITTKTYVLRIFHMSYFLQ
jgi:hypothetical protein